jgi:uncharacterized protein (DUF1015 family)
MARIYPFRALRYDTNRVRMEDVVTQPYDKISPEMQQRYYERSPYNLIRIILGKHEPWDTDHDNVYTRAAHYLHDWRREHILAEEAEPALYGYSQTYTVPGTSAAAGDQETRERRGFIALGHLYDYADKVVYRHEQTFPKHKSDRLALFKATRAYCEQIYMLYSDPAFTAEKLIFGSSAAGADSGSPADLQITDEYNVVHRLWRLTDPSLINLIVTAMADKKLLIADGHHRYETSVEYAKLRSAQLHLPFNQRHPDDESPSELADENGHPQLPTPAYPEAAMMMTFVNMDAPGITILPTHRVVFGLEDFSSPDFIIKASAFFDITELHDSTITGKVAQATLDRVPGPAFLAVTGDGNYLLLPKPDAIATELADISPRQRQLDVVQLHTLLLNKLLNLDPDSVRDLRNLRYLRDADEAITQVQRGEANITFLIKPVTLDQLKEVSFSGEVMPQKSTDFYPKLLSGLAIYALD